MRLVSTLVAAMALVSLGCSHGEKKSEPETNITQAAKAPAQGTKDKVAAEKKSEGAGTKVECSVKGDERIIEVRAKDKGCEVAYTKAGKEGVVASSAHGNEYCEKTLEKIQNKLKGAGYECK